MGAVATSTRAPLKPERKAAIFTQMDGNVLEYASTSLLKLVPALLPLPHVQDKMGDDVMSALRESRRASRPTVRIHITLEAFLAAPRRLTVLPSLQECSPRPTCTNPQHLGSQNALLAPFHRFAPKTMTSVRLVHQTASLFLSTPVLRLPTRSPIVRLMLPSVRKSTASCSDVLVSLLVVHGKVLLRTSPPT